MSDKHERTMSTGAERYLNGEHPYLPHEEQFVWWCKLADGTLIEHIGTDFDHRGHVRCHKWDK